MPEVSFLTRRIAVVELQRGQQPIIAATLALAALVCDRSGLPRLELLLRTAG
jgi:hypothetical protein